MTALAEPHKTVPATDMLINLIVKRLLPMFFKVTDGDADAARAMATETVNAHCARNAADLLAVALIIACGMASLDNVILSMADDISRSLRLRLQGTTNALNRTIEQNRRFLKQDPPPRSNDFYYEPGPEDAALEASAIAGLAEAQRAFDEARAQLDPSSELAAPRAPEPRQQTPEKPEPAKPAPGTNAPKTPAPDLTEHEKALIWAAGMNRVAAEYAASIPHLPPSQRRAASLRMVALSSTASSLIAGTPPDPFLLPKSRKTPDPRP